MWGKYADCAVKSLAVIQQALPVEGREKFVPLPDISPVAVALDPRTPEEEETPVAG